MVHTAFPETQNFREGRSIFKWAQNSLQLRFTDLGCKCFLGSLKSNFKNEAAAWMKQNLLRNITPYHMASLIWFALNKAASMSVDVSALESTGIYALNCNRVSDYFFPFCDTSETITLMETAPPDMTPICAPSTSETNSQNMLHI